MYLFIGWAVLVGFGIWWWNPGRVGKAADFWCEVLGALEFCCDCVGVEHEECEAMYREIHDADSAKQIDDAVRVMRFGGDPATLLSPVARKWLDRYRAHKALLRGDLSV